MLRYTRDRPGLGIFYDIRPGNEVSLFFNPGTRSPAQGYF